MTQSKYLLDLKRQRDEFAELLPEWVHEQNLQRGHYSNRIENLLNAFCEWLDKKEPGAGAKCKHAMGPLRWRTVFRLKYATRDGKGSASFVFLNQFIAPVGPVTKKLTVVCPTCKQPRRIPEPVKTKEELLAELKENEPSEQK